METKKPLNLEVSLKDTDIFKKLLKALKDVLEDKRISDDVKSEIKNKINKIIEVA